MSALFVFLLLMSLHFGVREWKQVTMGAKFYVFCRDWLPGSYFVAGILYAALIHARAVESGLKKAAESLKP